MFYISKRYNLSQFGVVDTDDGKEDIMTRDEIEYACIKLGIHIEGVTLRTHSKYKDVVHIERIDVYVPPENRTVKETKLRTVKGVDIKTVDGQIVSIDWIKMPNANRVVRLSDYGVECGADLFPARCVGFMTQSPVADQGLTLVLDDKLTVHRKAFKFAYNTGLVFDLREVTDQKIVNNFYQELLTDIGLAKIRPTVLDKDERLDYWIGVFMLNRGLLSDMSEYINDVPAVTKALSEQYRKEFIHLPNKFNYKFKPQDAVYDEHQVKYIRWLVNNYKRTLTNDFRTVFSMMSAEFHEYVSFLRCIRTDFAGGDSMPFLRLLRYVQMCDPSPEAKKAFVEIYHRANEEYLKYGISCGLVEKRGSEYVLC